ncbi:CDP-glucose 4,6-dehydratase [Paenibacillus dendritiformis]|uniref:CDP-glucose 4,6-dehydratase n=1 Tax=Paenibacillus dendritiformis TaxID=130049 RepID=UPI00387E0EAF
MVDIQFWNGKKVFITGHSGFKGGWLTLWLSLMGAEVIGYSLSPPTTPNLFEAARIHTSCRHSIRGDITHFPALLQAFSDHQPEVVFHLAAQPLVQTSYIHPVHTFQTNVIGTVHLLEAVRQTPSVRVVVNVTSDKCYLNDGQRGTPPFREGDPLGGHDPYSASKACAEIAAACYQQAWFQKGKGGAPRLASVRAGNVIGGGDWADGRLLPDIIRAYTQSAALVIRNPHAIRPWQHVLDPLHGYILLAEKLWESPSFAEAWNFGPVDPGAVSVEDIVRMATELWGEEPAFIREAEDVPYEAPILMLDSWKAVHRLGWRPKLSTREAVEWTVTWHRQYGAGTDARRIAEGQIASFITR